MPDIEGLKTKLSQLHQVVNDSNAVFGAVEGLINDLKNKQDNYDNAVREKRTEYLALTQKIAQDKATFDKWKINETEKSEQFKKDAEKILSEAALKNSEADSRLEAVKAKEAYISSLEAEIKAKEAHINSKISQLNNINTVLNS